MDELNPTVREQEIYEEMELTQMCIRDSDYPERQLQPSGTAQGCINLRWRGNF